MSPTGQLVLHRQDDGDIVVTVMPDNGLMASVEFCTSGGKSPRTLQALHALLVAMAEDNADRAYAHRRGRFNDPLCDAPTVSDGDALTDYYFGDRE